MLTLAGLSPLMWGLALLVSLGAGAVRGFAGFGYSALTVAALSIVTSPGPLVPAVLSLEVLASLSLVREALRDADRGWLRWLLAGNLVFVPVGVWLLARLPEDVVRLVVAGALMSVALFIRVAGARTLRPSPTLKGAAGVASGLLNGLTASGGIAAALVMAGVRLPSTALRGTMILFLLCSGAYAVLWAALMAGLIGAQASLVGPQTLAWVLLLGPSMFAGIWLGRRAFHGADPARYRGFVLNLLMAISAIGLLRASVVLWR
ncbi:MAG: sulfite exporter TauE/SafE family protein [Rubrivivax sp.]